MRAFSDRAFLFVRRAYRNQFFYQYKFIQIFKEFVASSDFKQLVNNEVRDKNSVRSLKIVVFRITYQITIFSVPEN
jgi:hypothetical protein